MQKEINEILRCYPGNENCAEALEEYIKQTLSKRDGEIREKIEAIRFDPLNRMDGETRMILEIAKREILSAID